MLTLSNLQFAYPNGAPLTYPDVAVARGQALLVTGASGCGKTTLLHIIAGLHAAKGGAMQLDGRALKPQADVALVPQIPHLIGSLTVAQNVASASFAAGKPLDAAFCAALLQELGIGDLAQRRPAQLSRGQAQRVALARALSVKPAVLLADEPTANLDDEATRATIDLLIAQAKAHNAALLVASHDGRVKPLFAHTLDLRASSAVFASEAA
ncbi:MAG: ATP-binding cassette domain-containing protein [Burkholderiaceae bacterium]